MAQTSTPTPQDRVARGVGTVLLARLGALIEVVAQPLYVAMFGLAGYGLYAVLWAAANLAENVFDLGMTSALQRTVPQAASPAEEAIALRTALLWGVTPCLIVAALVSAFAEPLSAIVNVAPADTARVAPAIAMFAWALPLWAFVEIATSALRAKALFGPEIRLRILWEQIIRLGLAGALWAAGWGVTGLLVAHLASLAITAALTLRLIARYYTLRDTAVPTGPATLIAADGRIARQTLLAGLAVLPANIVARLFGDAPALILNVALPGAAGASAAALFVIARKLSSVVQLVRTAFVYVLAPLASSAERENRAGVAAIYAFATRLILVVAVPLGMALSAGAAPLLTLFGREAAAGIGAVVVLFIARAVEAVVGTATPVLQVIGGLRHQITGSALGLAIAALVAWLSVPALGWLTGLTAASATGFVVAAAVPMAQLWRYEGLHPFGAGMVRAGGGALAVGGVVLLIGLALTAMPPPVAIPAIIALALAGIWSGLRLGLAPDDRAALGSLGRRLGLA